MSNLFKSGFVGIGSIEQETLILDMNPRAEAKEKQNRVIRSVDEQATMEELLEEQGENNSFSDEKLLAETMEKASKLHEDAKLEAEKIISDARAEAEVIRENAQNEGYNQGIIEGKREASKENEIYLANLQKEQKEQFDLRMAEEEAYLRDAELKMIDVSCQLIEKLTGVLVRDYQPVLLHMINNALNEVETSKKFVIRVSESRYPYIYDNRERIAGAANPNITIEIFGDARLEPHQCMIESDNGIIDLSMDLQAQNLITAIKLLSV